MGSVIELDPKRVSTLKATPIDLFALRWRLLLKNGATFNSAWLPETRYPSIADTFETLKDQISCVFIDGQHRHVPDERLTFLKMPADAFFDVSYKGGFSAMSGKTIIMGIEVRDIEGNRYLVLRDGTVHIEKKLGGKAHVANDNS